MKNYLVLLLLSVFALFSCTENAETDQAIPFTGNEIRLVMIPGTVLGNTTSGQMVIKERTDGRAQIEITMENILKNGSHPIHLHFGSLADDDNVATLLNELKETNGVGRSSTILGPLEDGTQLTYTDLINFDGSIKIHFEASGPLEDEILGAINIGINESENMAYFSGEKSITQCNSEY